MDELKDITVNNSSENNFVEVSHIINSLKPGDSVQVKVKDGEEIINGTIPELAFSQDTISIDIIPPLTTEQKNTKGLFYVPFFNSKSEDSIKPIRTTFNKKDILIKIIKKSEQKVHYSNRGGISKYRKKTYKTAKSKHKHSKTKAKKSKYSRRK